MHYRIFKGHINNDKMCPKKRRPVHAPAGHDHCTLRLLADKVVELGYAESFSYEAVRRLLKKHVKTLAGKAMVYPHRRGGLCRGDGRCA